MTSDGNQTECKPNEPNPSNEGSYSSLIMLLCRQ